MMGSEASVLTVSLLEPSEVTFKGIGRGSDHGIVKVTEHIRQSGEQHAAGALEIAKHPTRLCGVGNVTSVPTFPSTNLGEKAITVRNGADGHDLQKQGSEVFGVGAFGMLSTPAESLSLDMHQAPLNYNFGPHTPEDTQKVWIPVDSRALGD